MEGRREITEYQKLLKRHGLAVETTGVMDAMTQRADSAFKRVKKGRRAAQLWEELRALEDTYQPMRAAPRTGNPFADSRPNSRREVVAEVYRVRHALTNTYLANYSERADKEDEELGARLRAAGKDPALHRSGGHFCWDWSLGFTDAIEMLNLYFFDVENRAFRETGGGWDHFCAYVHPYREKGSGSVAIDDAFVDGHFVHTMPFPSPDGYRDPRPGENMRPSSTPDKLNPVIPRDDDGNTGASSHEKDQVGVATVWVYPRPNQGVKRRTLF